ncbi:UvrABC system protein C [Campylobacterota bacterium]|nr:UvrABC system protein C [Campylobacterota bacterium]
MGLLETIRALPDQSGVYQYFDLNGRLLYVGKAKSLKNRVKSYFSFTPALAPDPRLSQRIAKMIGEANSLEYIIVANESDALILENSLIKQLKPKYNILLRDDKTYPYIYIDLSLDFPRFEITRKVITGKKIRYFGPFASGARDILNAIYELFALVQKKSCIKEKHKCVFYQINRCLAPCENLIASEEYMQMINEAIRLINNKDRLAKLLEEKMFNLAQNERFEEAAILRDRIQSITASTIASSVDLATNENFDCLSVAELGEDAVAVRLFVREGKMISSSHQSFRFSQGYDLDEAYERAFVGFYNQDMPITATTIYVCDEFAEKETITAWLERRFNKKFEIVVPKIGTKKALVDLARRNAEEHIKNSAQKDDLLSSLKALLGFENLPIRIEGFDNSHMMGSAPVGAMIVYEQDKFIKSDYKHFNLEATNEYDQMREMLTRRVEKFSENPPPDCWVIDGGETLRTLAKDILASVGVTIDLVAISKEKLDSKAHRAKGAAKDILYANGEAFRLLPNDRRLMFFQNIRDESHRFAIGFHRKQKQKSDLKLTLLENRGVGTASVKRLINVFGSFEAIEAATFDEIKAATNIKIAKALKPDESS